MPCGLTQRGRPRGGAAVRSQPPMGNGVGSSLVLMTGPYLPTEQHAVRGQDFAARTTVLIVVGVRLYREGLATALARDERLEVVGTAANVDDALELARELRPDVALVDLQLADGARLVRACTAETLNQAVLALTRSDTEEELLAVAEAGLTGYVTHNTSLDELVLALHGAAHGEVICSPRAAATLMRQVGALARRARGTGSDAELTARELQIAQLIDAGRSNK